MEPARFNGDPAKWWNQFYKNHTINFFKNRKWLQHEFPILAEITTPDYGPVIVLEVGAGAGNTAFPVLRLNENPGLKIHAVDFSKQAVELIRNHEDYNDKFIQADVWDITSDELPTGLSEGSVDIVILIFIFSALSPKEWSTAVRNVYRILKPGGEVLFRDYGRGDMAQVRFRKGRYLEENFYIRGDGTRVYFFDVDELRGIWTEMKINETGQSVPAEIDSSDQTSSEESHTANLDSGFEIVRVGVDRRMIVNRLRRLKMHRCWLQAKFVKRIPKQ
jgi:tRNAThr (cytosine32-N3)-methyltransferase